MRNTMIGLGLLAAIPMANAELIASDLVAGDSLNLTSFVNSAPAFSSPADGFAIYQRGVSSSIPFAVLDDSLSIFTGDTLGIIKEANTSPFFGVVDTQNSDNDGAVSASWTFAIGDAPDLTVAIDMGAMGDFEAASDSFVWSAAIDGGAQQLLFSSSVNEDSEQDYSLEGGALITLGDPLEMNDTVLNNDLTTLGAAISGTGAELIITLTVSTDGGSEAYVVQNLRVFSGEDLVEPPEPPEPEATLASIPEIQGAGHISPLVGELVETDGVVTALAFNGFYLQDITGDEDPATSDGIFVFTGGSPEVATGELVTVTATVVEFIPGGAGTGNLSITQLSGAAIETTGAVMVSAAIEPQRIGRGGRVPPNTQVIGASETVGGINLQNAADAAANIFNPQVDGIDFYESLEGMLVLIESPVAISGVRSFNAFSSEFFVLANEGADIAPSDARNRRGGIDLQPDVNNLGDPNPERVQIQLDGTLYPADVPAVKVGDKLGDVLGVVGYSFGNFEVNAIEALEVQPGRLPEERTRVRRTDTNITIASYNVLNLSPDASDDNQRAVLASQIVQNLAGPDVVALQEIQDNSGEVNDGTTDASQTLQALVQAISDVGGPSYEFFDVAPANNTGGGVPGGNIRNAYLYNPRRVSVDSFESLLPDALEGYGVSNVDAFEGTRAPLLAVFRRGRATVTVINNHLTSRFGSTPIFGGPQPFVQAGENAREAQVAALNEVVDRLLVGDPRRKIVVLGDLNTFEFTNDIRSLLAGTGREQVLFSLIDKIGDDRVYTFNFEGNSQVLDHILVSRGVRSRKARADIVHLNVDYPRIDDSVASDHEPLVMMYDMGPAALQ